MQILAMHGVLGFANEAWLENNRVKEAVLAALKATALIEPGVCAGTRTAGADTLQSVAQQLLLLGRDEDAEDWFSRCAKDSAAPRPERTARSCLVAGLQGLHRNQLRAAWTGLQHALDTKDAPLPMAVQALAALSALYFRLGMRRPALAAVDRALALLDTAPQRPALPRAVLQALRTEFVVLDLLRQHERLHDLAFWPRHHEVAGDRADPAAARALLQACRADVAGLAFLESRLDFLGLLLRIAYEGADEHRQALDHVAWLQSEGLLAHAHAARHELALACIASHRPDALRQAMLVYAGSSRRHEGVRHNLEHAYCLAKLGELAGNMDSYVEHYREYASRSLVHLRQTCAYITVPTLVRQAASDIPKDDVASRLSGRYRRAYQFILTHLQRDDLSIRQVAEAVGVTERSLQLAFRAALGLSPSALIRQCRMDRIREDLNSGAAGHGTTTLDVGRRWGLRSRSAMSQSYKAAFGELPSQTGGLPPVELHAVGELGAA
jgi:AraC-like DNA-binding protein